MSAERQACLSVMPSRSLFCAKVRIYYIMKDLTRTKATLIPNYILLFHQQSLLCARVTCINRQRLFTFHVSECFCKTLIINYFREWNFAHEVSLLVSSLHFASLAPRFEISCTMFWNLLRHVFEMKHWKQKWNINMQCFTRSTSWLSTRSVIKMKHESKNTRR